MANTGLKKIAIVGPESTGKSTIAAYLAKYYNTIWIPEYARDYCSRLTEPCSWQDEINMFYGQIELEEKLLPQANHVVICDTTFITIKIWSEHVFGKAPVEVINELPKRLYDFYLLMDIDLAWEDDPLRDFPDLREYFLKVWHNELNALGANYRLISGQHDARNKNAIKAIDAFLKAR